MFIRIFLVILPEKMMVEMVAWSAPVGEDESKESVWVKNEKEERSEPAEEIKF